MSESVFWKNGACRLCKTQEDWKQTLIRKKRRSGIHLCSPHVQLAAGCAPRRAADALSARTAPQDCRALTEVTGNTPKRFPWNGNDQRNLLPRHSPGMNAHPWWWRSLPQPLWQPLGAHGLLKTNWLGGSSADNQSGRGTAAGQGTIRALWSGSDSFPKKEAFGTSETSARRPAGPGRRPPGGDRKALPAATGWEGEGNGLQRNGSFYSHWRSTTKRNLSFPDHLFTSCNYKPRKTEFVVALVAPLKFLVIISVSTGKTD